MADRRLRRFGATRQHTTRIPTSSTPHGRTSDSFRYSNTLEFDAVALEHSVPRPHQYSSNWDDNNDQFDFSHDSPRQLRGPHAPPKYKCGRPKASGQTIEAPGSSFAPLSSASSDTRVTDGVLTKVFIPPKIQSAFLNSLTTRNTNINRGPGTCKSMPLLASTSSLEVMSAPEPQVDISRPHFGSSGWKNMRVKQIESKPRALSMTTKKETLVNKEKKSLGPVEGHYSLRDRGKTNLFGYAPPSSAPVSFGTKLGKRKLNSEGSAAKPIALDSDSESDVQSNSSNRSNESVDNVVNSSRNCGMKNDVEASATDIDEITVHALARIENCDVMIGRFQCIVDLIVALDWLCLRNIRGKFEKWPLKEFYLLNLDRLDDVRIYNVAKEAETSLEVEVDETNRMEQLLDEAAYMAIKVPFLDVKDQFVMKSFYNPASSDISKGFMVIRPLKDTIGEAWAKIQEVLRSRADVQILERVQATEHLQALTEEPFNYMSSQRSLQQIDEAENPSESEDIKATRNTTVLTYPLPPCTSDIVTIIRRDVARLDPRRYLNDNIIDYYFKRMMLTTFKDNQVVQKRVLFLSSHFYTRLRAGKGLTTRERMEAGYRNVSTWLARTGFFTRSIIFIPINKDLHWSLAVILNPGLAGPDAITEEAFPCIAVLDPLGSYHRKTAIVRNLRTFLRMQWENSQDCSEDKMDAISEYEVDRVLTLNVNAPQQGNSYDCGVYVLKFAEVILQNCLELQLLSQHEGVIGKHVTDANLEALITSSAFSADDIFATRKQIRQYIEADASEYQVRRKEKGKPRC